MDRVTRIDGLRKLRVRPEPELGVGDAVRAQLASMKRCSDAESRVRDAWERAAPEGIRASVAVGGVSRGVLTLRAAGAPARYAADRWLRSGGLRAISAEAGTRLARARVVAGG